LTITVTTYKYYIHIKFLNLTIVLSFLIFIFLTSPGSRLPEIAGIFAKHLMALHRDYTKIIITYIGTEDA